MSERDKIPYGASLKSMLVTLVKQAQADGIITSDEGELINRIQIDTRDLEEEIAKAVNQGDRSLEDVIKEASEKIIRNATETAKKDGIITDDEEALLNKLISELENVKDE